MHDFDFDAMQKKRIARGAAHMKRGSKSKRCSLPSDHMTQAEWKRRNGPVSTYKMDEPISWKVFKNMPLDIQQRYISNLQSRFQVSAAVIGMDLFGKTPTTVRLHLDKHGIKYSKMQGASMNADKREAWMDWLSPVAPEWANPEEDPVSVQRYLDANAASEIPDEKPEPPVIEEDPEVNEIMDGFKAWSESLQPSKPLSLDELTAVFTGVFSPTAFLQWLAKLPIPEDKVRIRVEVTRE